MLSEKPGEHKFIVTKPGRGYRFVADVAIAAPPVAEGLRLDHRLRSATPPIPVPSVGSTDSALGVPRRRRYTVSVAASAHGSRDRSCRSDRRQSRVRTGGATIAPQAVVRAERRPTKSRLVPGWTRDGVPSRETVWASRFSSTCVRWMSQRRLT